MWVSTSEFLGQDFSVIFDRTHLLFSGFFSDSNLLDEWQGIPLSRSNSDVAESVISAYRSGDFARLALPLKPPKGTLLQRKVWGELMRIPSGELINYSELAVRAGNANAVRAVGSACGKNAFSLVVPCHRVRGKAGLGGYRWGVEIKKSLINHEQSLNGCCKTETAQN